MGLFRGLCVALTATLLVVRRAAGQTITPQNWTAADANQENTNVVTVAISFGPRIINLLNAIPIASGAMQNIQWSAIQGTAVEVSNNNQLSISRPDVAVLACDPSAYPGNIGPLDVFANVVQANPRAIVWYSGSSDWCNLQGYTGSYQSIFSTRTINDGSNLTGHLYTGSGQLLTIGASASTDQIVNGTSSNSTGYGPPHNQQNNNPLGPSPTTAVAMIILYSITGIITALFLIIIITGAIRAHRHPERYGPRNVIGRPRQSRARGLARAMLDTIPIVKFGEREQSKSTDVELAEHNNADVVRETRSGEAEAINQHPKPTTVGADPATGQASGKQDQTPPELTQGGIAAATVNEPPAADAQGCSICTEDFELGQDQRVLPCDHRFHPACIDPWLLNVSGTCPLCRIDLRPQKPAEGELDEQGNPLHRQQSADGGEVLPPPLIPENESRRVGVMRSLGVLGLLSRPDSMSREDRIIALRELRRRQAIAAARQQIGREAAIAGNSTEPSQAQDEEAGLRARLRNAFRVRTRRTGQEEAQAPAGAENESTDAQAARQGASGA
ncbi:hypothetical protein BAUCODRAFT_269426 [Baudoinia panamericana UAMH 10762]|uniref:RING-type domain-containing protein n=1 Tax=Baudoinia panamericana (strain UAMH 10762) TaxID=717646 RepID=M2MNI0_BAUPA|nr:uncharacterized protein BAUCODRAFT_269426 [Baudoinia panamericana UAMH 10762]EMC92993.1 hypothetical protein BAUCODRAFT_269426 [Baudoinia panamericana UAMH 10762]